MLWPSLEALLFLPPAGELDEDDIAQAEELCVWAG